MFISGRQVITSFTQVARKHRYLRYQEPMFMDLKYHKLNSTIGYWKYQLVLSCQPLGQDNRVLMAELRNQSCKVLH